MRLDLNRETGNWPFKQHVLQVWGSYQKKTVGCLLVGTVLLTTGVAANPLLSSKLNSVQWEGNALRSVDTLIRQQAAAERRQQVAAEREQQRQATAERRRQEAERHRQWFNSLSPEQQAAERARQQKEQETKALILLGILGAMGGGGGVSAPADAHPCLQNPNASACRGPSSSSPTPQPASPQPDQWKGTVWQNGW